MALPTLPTIPIRPDKDTLALILRYGGVGSLIAVGLVLFLAQVLYGQQDETLRVLAQHQSEAQAAADKHLRVLQLICASVAPDDVQRQWCFALAHQPEMVK